ncbi:Sulfhydryl oxidase, partial [Rhizoctonia solani]
MTTHHPLQSYVDPLTGKIFGEGGVEKSGSNTLTGHEISGVRGGVIMPKLGNATANGTRSINMETYKPSEDERKALESFFYLTSRLYPCGECATEFQALLKKYPPQTSSRMASALWLCSLHNMVNARLKKPEFDCTKLDETYDCGCGPEGTNSTANPLKAGGRKEGDPDELTGAELIKGGIGP